MCWLGESGIACAGGEEGSEQTRRGGDLCTTAPTRGQQGPQTEWQILPIFLVWRWSREVRRPFLAAEDIPLVVRMKGRAAEEEREFVMERVLAPSEVLQSAWVGSVWPFS